MITLNDLFNLKEVVDSIKSIIEFTLLISSLVGSFKKNIFLKEDIQGLIYHL